MATDKMATSTTKLTLFHPILLFAQNGRFALALASLKTRTISLRSAQRCNHPRPAQSRLRPVGKVPRIRLDSLENRAHKRHPHGNLLRVADRGRRSGERNRITRERAPPGGHFVLRDQQVSERSARGGG